MALIMWRDSCAAPYVEAAQYTTACTQNHGTRRFGKAAEGPQALQTRAIDAVETARSEDWSMVQTPAFVLRMADRAALIVRLD
jgi:hypothetical protein